MNRRQLFGTAFLLAVLCAFASVSAAQQPAPAKTPEPTANTADKFQFYRLDYSLREIQDGKVVNTRNFITRVRGYLPGWGGARFTIRVGTRVPINAAKDGVQYIDVGVNIDSELGAPGSMGVTMDITSLATRESGQLALTDGAPLLRNIRGTSSIPLILNRQILVTSVDDILSQKRYELLVTITRDE